MRMIVVSFAFHPICVLDSNNNPLPKVIGINNFPSGTLFLEMDSENSAKAMQQPIIATNFISNFIDTYKTQQLPNHCEVCPNSI